jgi:hypothetical protein
MCSWLQLHYYIGMQRTVNSQHREETANTAHHSPKVASFADYPQNPQPNSQAKMKVYSNPRTNCTHRHPPAIDWLPMRPAIQRTL